MIFRGLEDDETGVMVFALIAVVILLLSIALGAYYADIRLQRQEEVTDTAGIKEIEVRLNQIENELENAVWEAGQEAVREVRSDILESGESYTLNELRYKVGENTTEIFEDYFEENHENSSQIGGNEIHMHLRPIPENRTNIKMIPLYIQEVKGSKSGWKEIPGFFRVERTIQVDIKGEDGPFSSRKLRIDRTVKTNFFILAERMNHFRLSRVERMTNTMLFAYLHTRIYDSGDDFRGSWFDRSFDETFNYNWLSDYDGRNEFDEVEKEERDDIWKRSGSEVEGFLRDIGRFKRSDILNKSDVEGMAKLALLLEQIRTFRSYDEELLKTVSFHFDVTTDTLLDYLGEGLENKINIEALIIKLYQEKGVLSDRIHYSGPFLSRALDEDLLGAVEGEEEWINTSFGILKTLIQGDLLEEGGSWNYSDLSEEVTPLSTLDKGESYLRGLVSLHPNVMEETFEAFKVDEADDFVKEKIGSLETLKWMSDTSIIGEEGIENVTDSILYTATNLSESFGFQGEGSLDIGSTFYYMYFLSDWGFEKSWEDKTEPSDRLNEESMRDFIHGKINNELGIRETDMRNGKESEYEKVVDDIKTYNETDWYDGDDDNWRNIWDDLNETKEIVENLNSDALFKEGGQNNCSETLEENYSDLEDKSDEIKENISWMDTNPEDQTLGILDRQKNFTRKKWKMEVYENLSDDDVIEEKSIKDHILYVDDFLNAKPSELNTSYGWKLINYSVSDDIDIPPDDFKESVGYAALGSFTENLERDFLAPLNHTNSFKFFQRVNQNIFDLGNSRGENDKSRLESILLGEGDPYSDTFDNSEDVKVPLSISKNDIHSSDLEDIKNSWIDESYKKTIQELEYIEEDLQERADELSKESLSKEPYQKYGLASFYRGTNRILSPLAKNMESYRKATSSRGDDVSFLYDIEGKTEKLPVVNAPLGGLTVRDSKGEENGFSYTFDFDIDMSAENELIRCDQINNATTRLYEDDVTASYEWTNPFSEENQSYYNTFLSAEFITPNFDIEISPSGDYIISSEKYASAGYKRSYGRRNHNASTELVTPMPFLEDHYNPASTKDLGLNNISLSQNVFNRSENEFELSFDVENQEPTKFIVEVLQKEDVQTRSAVKRRKSNYYSAISPREGTTTLLKRKNISTEEEEAKISLSFDGKNFPKEGLERSQIILSIKPEMKLGMMHTEQNLTQEPAETDELYSRLPSTSTSEQIYFVEEEKESYIGIFNFSSGIDEKRKGEFDLIKNIPDESWVIEKNGIPFLVGFEDLPGYRELIAGRYGTGVLEKKSEENNEMVDPLLLLEEREAFKYSFLPESELKTILKNEFVSLFMAASDGKNHFYPVRVLPELSGNSQERWGTLENRLERRGYTIGDWMDVDLPGLFKISGSRYLKRDNMMGDLDLGVGGYLYYSLDKYQASERVSHSFNSIREFGKNIGEVERRRKKTDLLIGMNEDLDVIRESDLVDEFVSAGRREKEDLFIAACKLGNDIDRIEEFEEDFEEVSKGSLAAGVNILGEDRTEKALEWFEDNRAASRRDKEFRSFLSFNDSFIQELPERYDGDDYGEALSELEKDLAPMNFREGRDFGVKNSKDIDSVEYLQQRYENGSILASVGYGLSPAALKEVEKSEYHVGPDKLSNWMDDLSHSHYLPEFVNEVNAGEHRSIPSLSYAARSNHSSLEWMPFGDEGPPLLIGDKVVYYNMSVSDDIPRDELEILINRTIEDASKCFDDFKERGHIVIEVKGEIELKVEETSEIRSFIKNRTKEHSPEYHSIGSVEVRSKGKTKVRYIHL